MAGGIGIAYGTTGAVVFMSGWPGKSMLVVVDGIMFGCIQCRMNLDCGFCGVDASGSTIITTYEPVYCASDMYAAVLTATVGIIVVTAKD